MLGIYTRNCLSISFSLKIRQM